MKKFAVLFVAVLFSFVCFAEGVDYSSMATDELIEMRNAITNELNSRYSSDVLTDGKYTEGVDIKSGTYVLTAISIYEGEDYIYIASLDANGDPMDTGYLKNIGESFTVRIDDGYSLRIFDGECGVMPLTNSFMP